MFSFWDMVDLTKKTKKKFIEIRRNFILWSCDIFSLLKKVKNYQDRKKKFRPISMNIFLGTFQTILRRKKIYSLRIFYFFKNVINFFEFFFVETFFLLWTGGFAPSPPSPIVWNVPKFFSIEIRQNKHFGIFF